MKKTLIASFIFVHLSYFATAQNPEAGGKTFKAICAACHSIGKGKIVGPDLANVTSRRNEKWLLSFVKSSQKMVQAKDPVAVKLFNDHNKMVMPDQNLADAQIKDVLAFVKSKSVPQASQSPAAAKASGNSAVAGANKQVVSGVKKAGAVKPAAQPSDNWVDAEYKIISTRVVDEINVKDLSAPIWNNAKATSLPLGKQNIAYPTLKTQSVESLTVKSVYRENQVAFLMEWIDSSKNSSVDVDKFCDQLAIEFPLSADNIPSYMMGNKGGMVHIVHWKAIWQEDCAKGFQDVQVMYPNMWVDVYPGFEANLDRSKRVYAKDITAEQMVDTRKVDNMPGTYSKNPMSQIKRKEPVEEASAEGFGTLSTQESQQAKGWAEWKDGKWRVCITVAINTSNTHKATIKDRTKAAFAIWDGGYQNIGGRKQFIPWVDLILENKQL